MESDVRAKLDAAWKLRCLLVNDTAGTLADVILHAKDTRKLQRVRAFTQCRIDLLTAEAAWIDALSECCGDINVDCDVEGNIMRYTLETGEVFENRVQIGRDDLDEDEQAEAKTTAQADLSLMWQDR
jgi:hypothetical protein